MTVAQDEDVKQDGDVKIAIGLRVMIPFCGLKIWRD